MWTRGKVGFGKYHEKYYFKNKTHALYNRKVFPVIFNYFIFLPILIICYYLIIFKIIILALTSII